MSSFSYSISFLFQETLVSTICKFQIIDLLFQKRVKKEFQFIKMCLVQLKLVQTNIMIHLILNLLI